MEKSKKTFVLVWVSHVSPVPIIRLRPSSFAGERLSKNSKAITKQCEKRKNKQKKTPTNDNNRKAKRGEYQSHESSPIAPYKRTATQRSLVNHLSTRTTQDRWADATPNG
jgi:hypothetical protein